jgi:nucleotide-binding universal stress UspA family protein
MVAWEVISMLYQRPLVVGVDGSEAALAALDWAVREAVDRDRRLRIIHAFIWPLFNHVSLGPLPSGPPSSGLRAAAQRIINEAVRRAATMAPGLVVEAMIHSGAAGPVLLAEAENAHLMVVGSRGFGGFTGLLLGSVSSQLAAHSPCSVIITRSPHADHGRPVGDRVVVGVEDPQTSAGTVEFALTEADRLSLPVTLISCVPPEPVLYGVPLIDQTVLDAQRELLTTTVEEWQRKFLEVEISDELVRDTPGHALVTASKSARLVVVGAGEAGRFRGLRLGSVSQQVLHHASSPVAIVRPNRHR